MSQLSEIPGDNCALQTAVEAPALLKRGRRYNGEPVLTREQKLARLRERNHRIFSVPPVGKECDCGEPATLWNSGKDAVCARCEFLYSMAKRMEIQGRTLGFSRKSNGKYMPVERVPEFQMDLFHADVVFLADEITVVGHGVYHLRIEGEAA